MLTVPEHEKMREAFQNRFPNREATMFFSPSRINIIGEHIDYNGGKVLPAAISIGTYGLFFPSDEIAVYSLNVDHEQVIPAGCIEYRKENGWLNYITGMMTYMKEKGYRIGGISGIVYGNIPKASGLSSSASLELLAGYALNVFYNEGRIPMPDLILCGKDVENRYLGLHSGIMDQFAIGMGRKDHAILIDTATLEYEYVPAEFGEYRLMVLNTKKPRTLVDSKYNERCEECERGLQAIRTRFSVDNLCALSPEQLEEVLPLMPDETVAKRVRHVVEENLRVRDVMDALQKRDFLRFGRLLNEGHASLRDLYEVTGPELDALTDAAREAEGCIGARMTGAGFGGCAIALIRTGTEKAFAEHVIRVYRERTGLTAEIYPVEVSDGPVSGKDHDVL